MKWAQMSWEEKFKAVASIYGDTNSDCGADDLIHLWEQIQSRDLQSAYIQELARLLGFDGDYTPAHILQMMTASDTEYHWPAALRAAGIDVEAR